MRFRSFRNPSTYVILILYTLMPMLHSMVCAHCLGNASCQGETTIGHLQAVHDDMIRASYDGKESKTPGGQTAISFCSICANVLVGIESSSQGPNTVVAPYDCCHTASMLSELHCSIDKPPQNTLA